jgi:hypothetical protein
MGRQSSTLYLPVLLPPCNLATAEHTSSDVALHIARVTWGGGGAHETCGVPLCPHPPCLPSSPCPRSRLPAIKSYRNRYSHDVVVNTVVGMALIIGGWRQTLGVVVLASDDTDGVVSVGMRQLCCRRRKQRGLLLVLVVSGRCFVWVQVKVLALLHLPALRGSQGCNRSRDDNVYVAVHGGSRCRCPAHSHGQMVDAAWWAYVGCVLSFLLVSAFFLPLLTHPSLLPTLARPLGRRSWLQWVTSDCGGGTRRDGEMGCMSQCDMCAHIRRKSI